MRDNNLCVLQLAKNTETYKGGQIRKQNSFVETEVYNLKVNNAMSLKTIYFVIKMHNLFLHLLWYYFK